MSPERFEHLFQQLVKIYQNGNSRFKNSIPAAERSTLTLRSLASVDSQQVSQFFLRIVTTTVSNIIKETCIARKEILTDKFVKPLCCKTDWLEIARDLEGMC